MSHKEWSGRAPAPTSFRPWEGAPKTRSTPCPRHSTLQSLWLVSISAKNSFHIVGHDERGAIVLRQKWSRGQVEARFANLSPCLIGMEACVGAHHLSRKLNGLGHDARLMPAKYVRPYSKGQKERLPRRGGDRRGGAAADDEVRGDEDRGSARPAGTAPVCASDWSASATGIINQNPRLPTGARHCGATGTTVLTCRAGRTSWPRHPMCCRRAWCG